MPGVVDFLLSSSGFVICLQCRTWGRCLSYLWTSHWFWGRLLCFVQVGFKQSLSKSGLGPPRKLDPGVLVAGSRCLPLGVVGSGSSLIPCELWGLIRWKLPGGSLASSQGFVHVKNLIFSLGLKGKPLYCSGVLIPCSTFFSTDAAASLDAASLPNTYLCCLASGKSLRSWLGPPVCAVGQKVSHEESWGSPRLCP